MSLEKSVEEVRQLDKQITEVQQTIDHLARKGDVPKSEEEL